MLEYEDLSKYGIVFKQLITGPAPVGRILNYLILTGKGVLKHKNGSRDLSLKDNIASAWCSEFMVGLGLIIYQEVKNQNVYPLILTKHGQELFSMLYNYSGKFDENQDPTICRHELLTYDKKAYDLFFEIFKSSPVCINLCKYIVNSGTNSFLKTKFKDDYFECFKVLYEGGVFNRNVRTNAADNRVPSLLQLCKFFNSMTDDTDSFVFNLDMLKKTNEKYEFKPVDKNTMTALVNEENKNEKIINDLISKYGIDGTVAREIVTRNSSVQELFRNNLLAKYGCKCAMCSKTIESVMIASHIVPASKSNVIEKADCENGLLLCALHDKLFDRHMISFDFATGKLLCCKELSEHLNEYQLSKDFCLDSKFLTDERKEYLLKHNMEFYERNK